VTDLTHSTPGVQSPDLHKQNNFLLTTPLNFSHVSGGTKDDSGTIVQLDKDTIQTQITAELKHLLFVVDNNEGVKVYSSETAPTKAQVALDAKGNTTINYKQTVDSQAGTITMLFNGILSRELITVTYEQQYAPSMLINAAASDVVVTFTTKVRWVPTNQIPTAPGNARYRITSKGDIELAWSAGQHATAYDVYRLIADHNQQFQLLGTVKDTSYNDTSKEALQNIHATKGIAYAIFAVGPTGVENPGGIIISISA
jgi:hypothetical protein